MLAAACGGGGAAGAKSPSDEPKDEVGSIGELAAAQGGIAALGGAGNRDDGGTGAESAMSGDLRADEVDKRSPVRIDGLLKEWTPRTRASSVLAGDPSGVTFAGGVMYDDAKLYVAGEIASAKDGRSGKHAAGDEHASLVLAFPTTRGALKAYEIGFWAGKPGSSTGAVLWLSGPNKGEPVAGAKIVESDVSGGYVFEAALPWSSFAESRTMRVGLRGALRFDAGSRGTLGTGPGSAADPKALPPLPTAAEQAVVDGLLSGKNLASEKPKIDVYADLTGDDRKERVSVFGNFFTICGPGYRSGHQFFWRELAGEIVGVEVREVTGRGKDDLIVRRRVTEPTASHEVLEVWSLVPGDEPVTVFAHQIAVTSTDGKRKIASTARVSPKEIEIGVGQAIGWDAGSYREASINDAEPILLPWGTVKARSFKFDRERFEKTSEVAQAGKAAPAPAAKDPPASNVESAPSPSPRSADLGKQVLEAYYKDAGVTAGSKPRFDLEAQLAGDAKRERVVLVGRDLVILGPGIRNGMGYARLSLSQFESDKDVSEVTARDVTGDGLAEILVRGARHVAPAGGGERVDVDGLFIYQVRGDGMARILSIETGRGQGNRRVQGLVQFVPAKGGKGFDVDVRPGAAKGWTEKTYPWPQEKPGGAMEPLLLPWGKVPQMRYTFNGTAYAP